MQLQQFAQAEVLTLHLSSTNVVPEMEKSEMKDTSKTTSSP